MLKNRHSSNRMLGKLIVLFLVIGILTLYNGSVAFALDSTTDGEQQDVTLTDSEENGTAESVDTLGTTYQEGAVDPDDPANPADLVDSANPAEPDGSANTGDFDDLANPVGPISKICLKYNYSASFTAAT